jgi:hypothetical protein
MKRLLRSGWFRSAVSVATLAAFSTVACGGDENGTDIDVGGKSGSAGAAGKGTQQAGSSSHAGNTTGGTADGGAPEGGAPDVIAGTAGSSSGGKAGAGGNSGSAGHAGSGGSAGNGGSGNGGSAGSAGHAGNGGSAGQAGAGGTAGSAGAGGSSAGTGGTAGSGGSAGTAGTAGTGGGSNQSCGNGAVEGTEECDDSGPSRLCSDACETVATQACVDCEQAGDCFASSDNCKGPTATPFTPVQVGICYDVFQCIQDSNCFDGVGSTLGKCYCGTLSTAACGAAPFDLSQPGAPNGPCAEIMQLGNPGLSSNSAILGGLTTKSRPAGAAGQRLNCEKTDETCAPICGVQ